jgi:hypothetical protein
MLNPERRLFGLPGPSGPGSCLPVTVVDNRIRYIKRCLMYCGFRRHDRGLA